MRPQQLSFADSCHAEQRGTGIQGRACHPGCAVPIPVGLDDGHEPGGFRQRPSKQPDIALDGIEIDIRARGTNTADIKLLGVRHRVLAATSRHQNLRARRTTRAVR